MSNWVFDPVWQSLDSIEPEEAACFAKLGIGVNEHWLTEFQDIEANTVATHPYLSAYQLAEWLAWNWWRLRWEGRSTDKATIDWRLAHQLSSIGGGYIWPNITMFSDGQRIVVSAKPTEKHPASSIRYLAESSIILPADDWTLGIDQFIETVIARLHSKKTHDSNLENIWESVLEERGDVVETRHRKLEALLGYEPDEAPEGLMQQLINEQAKLGLDAVDELAAHSWKASLPTYEDIKSAASQAQCYSDERNRVQVSRVFNPNQNKPAWELGVELAAEVRSNLDAHVSNLTNEQLADLVGVSDKVLKNPADGSLPISLALKVEQNKAGIGLVSNWLTGRRFELARLLADLLVYKDDALSAATRSYTYRQKLQRAFAAELLCPFELLKADMDLDYSDENQTVMAEKYEISPLAIKTILINNGEVERDSDSWLHTA